MEKKRSYDLEFKLKVVEFSKTHANEATAREFNIDSRRVRHWKNQESELAMMLNTSREKGVGKQRLRLNGAGRQPRISSPMSMIKVEMVASPSVEHIGQGNCVSNTETETDKHHRLRYDPEFKSKVVHLAEKVGNRQAGRRYEIAESNVRRWRDAMESSTAPGECKSSVSSSPTNCANCQIVYGDAENDAEPVTEFTTTDTRNGEERHVPIAEAINTVFEAGLKLNKKSTGSTKLTMCYQCISVLAELYRFYIEFMELTQYESSFQKLISKSAVWNFGKSTDENEEESFEQLSLDIKIEHETDEWILEAGNLDPAFEPDENNSNSSGSDEDGDFDYSGSRVSRIGDQSEPTVITRSMRSGKRRVSRIQMESKEPSADSKSPKKPRRAAKQKLKLNKNKLNKKLTLKCTKCSRTFKDSQTLSTHMTNRHLITRHQCTQCEKSFKDKKLLTRHLKFKHGPAPMVHACAKCDKTFAMHYQLKIHIRSVHAATVECSVCALKLPNENSLRTHFQKEHPNDTLNLPPVPLQKCLHCPEEFENRQLLKIHVSCSHPSARLQCPQCPKSFRSGKLFRRHLKFKHGDGTEKLSLHRCTICPKSFAIPSQLRVHVKAVHAAENKFPCLQCDKMFPVENYVQNHVRRCHTVNTTQFKCEHCDKVYNSASGYQIHVDTKHLDKKDFVCETCGKRFVRPDWLRNHMQIHDTTRTREFSCPHCDLTFYTRSCRNNHLKTHSNLKQHLCSYCGTEFLHAVSLRRHIQVRHIDEVAGATVESHECQQCGKVFKLREYLLQHLRSKTHGGPGHTAEKRKSKTSNKSKSGESSTEGAVVTDVIEIDAYRTILPPTSSVATWYQPFYHPS